MLPPKPNLLTRLSVVHRRAITSSSLHQTPPLSLAADKCRSMDQLKQIHAQMITTAQIHDAFAASRLINFSALSDSGDLTYALKLFANIPAPNTFIWNTLIRAHATSSNPSAGLHLYSEMRRRAAAPGKHTFPFVLKACANSQSAKCTEQIHAHVLKFGLDSDSHVANGLIRAYSVAGMMGDARKVFDEMPDRNLSVWTTIICGYAQNNSAEEAMVLFSAMVSEGFEPSGVVLASVLSACAQSSCLSLGKEIHAYIDENGVEMNVILGTALINMYAKNGELIEARRIFDELRERNVATWNAMICGLALHGRASEAIDMFAEMGRVRPNGITLLGVLCACCHAGMVDFGREVFYLMERVYGVEPNLRHYGCMVDLLGRGGRILEAEGLIREMRWEADVAIWGALLSGCRSSGDIEAAERVVGVIQGLDPTNHGVHVVLSNMYAEAGRWEDVMNRRKAIKEGSLNKTAGWSAVAGDRNYKTADVFS
ncbi:pentatricopeptide repeat-containing protein At5g56310-like [Salvia hispanica]|uniref:pentatricopeptide repeat-containing protein At5g56310-like n=1 Tax=Salvia hispanica TaxID=49212 RepID=UPI0020093F9F|nr:pentatricopeptide repeat-containing protein At5g56310-like [Salvia hispanica]